MILTELASAFKICLFKVDAYTVQVNAYVIQQ